ncbi:MAG: hypothetical protein ACXWW5_01715, partial [Actinomycetota bacterium]
APTIEEQPTAAPDPANGERISTPDIEGSPGSASVLALGSRETGAASVSHAAAERESRDERPRKVCEVDWRDGRKHVKALIRCAARHFHVSVRTALYVADRESRFQPRAFNAGSCAKGIYQHLCHYWPERAQDFGFRGWSAFNGRANIMVTMKMVRRYGWEPWGG